MGADIESARGRHFLPARGVSRVDASVAPGVANSGSGGDGYGMGQLIDLIDEWRDRHGQPSEASVSRAISNSDKTVNAWRHRGIKDMPDQATLQKLAVLLNLPPERVVMAAAIDAGYLEERDGNAAPMNATGA